MSFLNKTKSFIGKCIRVLRVSRKPTGKEVSMVSKVSALGVLAIGALGFIISIIFILAF
jgi:protein transport protein SEC61 subunit gamma-like protein